MFTKYQNKIYIGGNKTNLIWPNLNNIANEKKINCLLNINNSKQVKYGGGKKKDVVNDISFCSICVDYGTLKYIAKDLNLDEESQTENDSASANINLEVSENDIAKLQQFKMGAIDQKGNIYIFDFEKNTYNLIARSGISANCISFNPFNKNEIIVGHTNKSIRSYNIGTKKLAAILPTYHHSEPYAFSFHPHQPYLLSTSFKDVIVWNINENTCLRVLKGIQDSEIQNAIFSNSGQQIIASFLNGNILIWNSESFNMEWKISLEALKNENLMIPKEHFPTNLQNTSLLVMSKDNTQLVYGGIGSTLFIWNINEKMLQFELNLTILNNSTLKRVEFIGNKKMVVALSNNGDLVFINTTTGTLTAFRNEIKCSSFTLSDDGEFIFLILNQKSKVLIYSTDKLINYQKPVTMEMLKKGSEEKSDEKHSEKKLNSLKKDYAKKKNKDAINVIEIDSNTTTQIRTLYETIDQHKVMKKVINYEQFKDYLSKNIRYPEKYRKVIWKYILRLPENKKEYDLYSSKEIHPAVINFKKKYPLKIYRVLRSMEKIMSMLCYWSPVFENIDYLPNMIFPFAKIYENDTFTCFEILLTVIINYCQKWWEFYPNPPIECLDMLESLLSFHDKELYNHFVKYNITSQYYGWELINNFFSDILSKDEWLCLWDNILTSRNPSYLYYFVIAYLKYFKKSILRITDIDDFVFFIHKENPCQFSKIIKLTYEIKKCTPDDLKFKKILKPYYSLDSNTSYPIFNEYPKYIVNYQSKLKEKIRLEEEEYLKKKKISDEMKRLSEELKKDYKQMKSNKWKMSDIVNKWWESMIENEEKYLSLKQRNDELDKEEKINDMKDIVTERNNFFETSARTQEQYISLLSKTIGNNQKKRDDNLVIENFNKEFDQVQKEWMSKKDELTQLKKDAREQDAKRMEELVININSVGLGNPNKINALKKKNEINQQLNKQNPTMNQDNINNMSNINEMNNQNNYNNYINANMNINNSINNRYDNNMKNNTNYNVNNINNPYNNNYSINQNQNQPSQIKMMNHTTLTDEFMRERNNTRSFYDINNNEKNYSNINNNINNNMNINNQNYILQNEMQNQNTNIYNPPSVNEILNRNTNKSSSYGIKRNSINQYQTNDNSNRSSINDLRNNTSQKKQVSKSQPSINPKFNTQSREEREAFYRNILRPYKSENDISRLSHRHSIDSTQYRSFDNIQQKSESRKNSTKVPSNKNNKNNNNNIYYSNQPSLQPQNQSQNQPPNQNNNPYNRPNRPSNDYLNINLSFNSNLNEFDNEQNISSNNRNPTNNNNELLNYSNNNNLPYNTMNMSINNQNNIERNSLNNTNDNNSYRINVQTITMNDNNQRNPSKKISQSYPNISSNYQIKADNSFNINSNDINYSMNSLNNISFQQKNINDYNNSRIPILKEQNTMKKNKNTNYNNNNNNNNNIIDVTSNQQNSYQKMVERNDPRNSNKSPNDLNDSYSNYSFIDISNLKNNRKNTFPDYSSPIQYNQG